MSPLLDHMALVDDHDVVRIHDGGETVGDDEGRAVGEDVAESVLNQLFALGIEEHRLGHIESQVHDLPWLACSARVDTTHYLGIVKLDKYQGIGPGGLNDLHFAAGAVTALRVLFGAALFFGNAVLTPAISVVSAPSS